MAGKEKKMAGGSRMGARTVHATGGVDEATLDAANFNVYGGDWDAVTEEIATLAEERIVVNLGPSHPSTHGVLRLVVELDGEIVRECRAVIGHLHTGIEKTCEYRTFTQGTTLVTRMDYTMPFFNEVAYCLSVERLLGIQAPERADIIRVLLMELNRIGSHCTAIGPGGMELGATSVMEIGFRMRERALQIFEEVTGLRMNHGYIRPGGVSTDITARTVEMVRERIPLIRNDIKELEDYLVEMPLLKARYVDVGVLDLTACMALGITGPVLRSTGYPLDLRKTLPYCGYESYDFEVHTHTGQDAYGRMIIRLNEMRESLKIIEQTLPRLEATEGQPVMVSDRRIAWPAQLSVGADGQGNSLEHIREIMGESMESLIHHFKLVTEGFHVPAGQAYVPIESPKGELGCHVVSMGGTRPWRVHMRDPSFHHLQALATVIEGGWLADAIVAAASLDPVMGGVDR